MSTGFPSSCKSFAPSTSTSNAGQMTKQLMDSIGGSQGCDMNSMFAAVAGKGSVGFGMGSASFAASVGDLHKVGCQSINALVGNFLNSVYTARCIVQNDGVKSTTNATINQNMTVNATGAGTVITNTCPPGTSDYSQSANISAKVITTISATAIQHIATVIQQGMQNTADQMQKSISGFQATGSGAKQAQEMQQQLTNSAQSSDVKNNITALINKFNESQNLTFNASAGAVVTVVPCKWTPHAVMDLQIANIVSSAYSSDVTNSIGAFLKSDMAQQQIIKDKGAPDVVGDLFNSGSILEYIVGAVVLCILGYSIYKFQSNKKAKAKLAGLAGKLGSGDDSKLAELAFRFGRKRR